MVCNRVSDWLSSASSTCSRHECSATGGPGAAPFARCSGRALPARPCHARRRVGGSHPSGRGDRAAKGVARLHGSRQRVPDLGPDDRERIGCHGRLLGERQSRPIRLSAALRDLCRLTKTARIRQGAPRQAAAAAFLFSSIWDLSDGQAGNRQDQARQHRRHRLLLRDQEEPAHPDREAGFRKYDPIVRKHVEFKEAKIK